MAFDFPSSPSIGQIYQGYTWDGEKWGGAIEQGAVRYDVAQALTAAQQSQARSNVNVTKKNYIINGAMQISQENGTSPVALSGGYYPVDMFSSFAAGTTGAGTIAQVASRTPGGSPNRLRITVTTADAAVAIGDYVGFYTTIEGSRAVDLKSGTAAAKQITLQFGVKAPAGTYCINLANAAGNRAYIAEYVIAAGEANTDVVKSVTLTLDVTGTWATDNTAGLYLQWMLMCGTTNQGSANVWAGSKLATSNQFNFMGTNGNIFELFDVSLTEGSVAPSFQVPDYATELALCQRYYSVIYGPMVFTGWCDIGLTFYTMFTLPVAMRVVPACSYTVLPTYTNASGLTVLPFSVNVVAGSAIATAGGRASADHSGVGGTYRMNARL